MFFFTTLTTISFGIELYMFQTVSLSITRSLASSQHNLYDIYLLLRVYSARLLMMDRETVRNT